MALKVKVACLNRIRHSTVVVMGDLSMRYIYRRLAVQDSVTIGPRAYLGGDKGHAPNGYNQWLPRMVILPNGHTQKKHSVFCTA